MWTYLLPLQREMHMSFNKWDSLARSVLKSICLSKWLSCGTDGTNWNLKKSGIQENKFGVIWSSFATPTWAAKSSAPDWAATTCGFWSGCFWLVFFAVLWDFFAPNDGVILIKTALKISNLLSKGLAFMQAKGQWNTLLPGYGQVIFSLFLQPAAAHFRLIQLQATFCRC